MTRVPTARQLYERLRAGEGMVRYRLGTRPALVCIDLQRAYTAVDTYSTAYATAEQLSAVAELAVAFRSAARPVVWTYIAYDGSGSDAGVWGTRSDTPDSVQNILDGSARARLDRRLGVDRDYDLVLRKRMPSAFFETNLTSLLLHHRVDTLVLAGGSSSGCLRATAVDAVSHGYPTVVVENGVSDKHESPHYAALYDLAVKYADVRPAADVMAYVDSVARLDAGA